MQWKNQHHGRRRKSGLSTVIGSLIFILILMAGFTTMLTIFNYYNSYNTQLLQYNQTNLQRQETSLSLSGFTFGSSPSTIATSSSFTPGYVLITITNGQGSATPNPFQQKITFTPSAYSSLESANLGNIRFCSNIVCSSPYYAWLESCTPSCSPGATSAAAWVRLTSSIAGSGGTLTIYMVFQPTSTNFDNNYWGEAPDLSGSYGQYDNGANVFTFYDNFAGTSLSAKWTTVSSAATVSVNNGITFTTTSSSGYAFVVSAVQTQPLVAEAYLVSAGSVDPMLGVSTTTSANNKIALYNGYSIDETSAQLTLTSERSGNGFVTVSSRSVSSINFGIWQMIWSATGSESASDGVNTLSGSSSATTIANYRIYLGLSDNPSVGSDAFRWGRMRAYPPSNVMPSTSFGALVLYVGNSATGYSSQTEVVYSQGLWWVFYSDGTNIDYVTSADGSVWTSPTVVTSSADSARGYDFNVWLSGNTIYYVLTAYGQAKSFLWRYGTLQNSGSISWTISETPVSTTNTVYSYNSVVTDASGNVWVALNTYDGTNTHVEVWKFASASWSKVNDISPLSSDETVILESLSSGIALIYGEGSVTAQVKITTTATGSSWSSAISPSSNYMLFSSSATTIGNTIYFVGLASGSAGVKSGTVNFWSFTYGASGASAESQLQSTSSGWLASITSVSPFSSSGTLIVFYGAGANLYYLYSYTYGSSWSSAQTISSSETSMTGVTSAEGGAAVLWTSGSSTPYNLRFASLPMLSTINNSPFAVHMISLYIYNTVSFTLIHFDTNAAATGVSGSFDNWIGAGQGMSIPLPYFAWTTSQNYLLTLTTEQGVVVSSTVVSPT